MEISPGLAAGLSQDFQYDQRIADSRYQQHALQQSKAVAEAKVKALADDLDFNNAMNPYDRKIVSEYAKNQIYKIGEFDRNNPDWRYNVTKSAQMKQLLHELKSNEHLARGIASDDAIKKYNADLQEMSKNPAGFNKKAYDDFAIQIDNYNKYGNQFGQEAALKEGARPLVYNRPRDFQDLSKKYLQVGNSFKDLKAEKLNNGRSGAWETVVDEKALDALANEAYLQDKEQLDQQHGDRAIDYVKKSIRSGIKTDFNWGDTHLQDELFLMKERQKSELDKLREKNKNGGNFDYYAETILKPRRTAENPERLETTFGTKIKHVISNDDGSIVIDNTGDAFNYNGDIQDKNYKVTKDKDGQLRYDYVPDGIKRVSGYVYKPLDWAKQNGVIYDPTGFDNDPKLAGTGFDDYKIDGGWRQKAEIVDVPKGKDGSNIKMVKLKVFADVDGRSPGYQGKYNSLVGTSEQRVNPSFTQPEAFVDEVGNVFDSQGNYIGKK